MSKYSSDIESFMSRDDLEGLIRFLRVLHETDNTTKNKLSSMAGRLSKLESDRTVGILSQDDYSKERNQIRYGIIQLSTEIETKVQRVEELQNKKDKLIAKVKKYGSLTLLSVALVFIVAMSYKYISHIHEANIPAKYIWKDINQNSLSDLYNEIEEDSTIGSLEFNNYIKYLYSISRGRDEYIKYYEIDSSSFDQLLENKKFETTFDNFTEELKENDISFF